MTSKISVDDFLSKKNIAVIGVSRKNHNFGNAIYKELKKKGYNPFGVNPNMDKIDGDKCYNNLYELHDKIETVICVVPKSQTEIVVNEANEIGIKSIWMQQGSQSDSALAFCERHGINVIHNECIFMFLDPINSYHSFHRWIWKVLDKLPK